MCGLFGFSDPSRSLTPRQARQLLRVLSVSSMVRGTDATGIAYNSHDRLHIYKRPDAANKTLLLPSASSHVVMGHVRMTTQGNAQSNYNNHPFPGNLDGHLPGSGPDFALAHNGILNNDLLAAPSAASSQDANRDRQLHCRTDAGIRRDTGFGVSLRDCRTAGRDFHADHSGQAGQPLLCAGQQSPLSCGVSPYGIICLCQHLGDSAECHFPSGLFTDPAFLSCLAGGGRDSASVCRRTDGNPHL